MPLLRKSIILAAFFGSIASAQVSGGNDILYCNAHAVSPPLVRSEGFSELIGDIAMFCSGGGPALGPGSAIPAVNISISFSTAVTSRLMPVAGDPSSSNFSEALLLVGEPGSGVDSYPSNLPKVLCSTPLTGWISCSLRTLPSDG